MVFDLAESTIAEDVLLLLKISIFGAPARSFVIPALGSLNESMGLVPSRNLADFCRVSDI
jgi:hypothetical protein